jgi:hypothetical protein
MSPGWQPAGIDLEALECRPDLFVGQIGAKLTLLLGSVFW